MINYYTNWGHDEIINNIYNIVNPLSINYMDIFKEYEKAKKLVIDKYNLCETNELYKFDIYYNTLFNDHTSYIFFKYDDDSILNHSQISTLIKILFIYFVMHFLNNNYNDIKINNKTMYLKNDMIEFNKQCMFNNERIIYLYSEIPDYNKQDIITVDLKYY